MTVHKNRPMKLTTALGEDALILTRFSGHEGLSELFEYCLETLWEDRNKPIAFEHLLGQKATVEIAISSRPRYFNGIVSRVTQGERDQEEFMHYGLQVVPQLWLLSRTAQSRIFQHLSVPQILQQVLAGMNVAYEIQGTFEPREYCVQYRETDFAFVSRLMEEEGIYYYFKHSNDGHKLVLANTPQSHVEIPYHPKVVYEEMSGHTLDTERVFGWNKVQEIRSGKYVAWDSTFEMPGKHLEAEKTILETVTVGRTKHKLTAGGNSKLEIYDYPGEYAYRFDEIDRGGGEQPGELVKIFTDNERTVAIRMQQEALPSLVIHGRAGHAGFTAGHTFDLAGHFSDDGKYVLTRVEHEGEQAIKVDSAKKGFQYENQFSCIPVALPFRPMRMTPVPKVQGVQTAVVVGPPDEEIFTDKYGRVKVQFPWDREGKSDANSSCWLRVATSWAGKNWGAIFTPRIGQEVIVDFLEGDPDRPIITGGVYNANHMPPYKLPDEKTKSTIKSLSSKGGGGFNELRFEDKKSAEQIFIHGQKDLDVRIEQDRREFIGQDRHLMVGRDKLESVTRDTHIKSGRDTIEKIARDRHLDVAGKAAVKIAGSHSVSVSGDVAEEFNSNQSTKVAKNHYVKSLQTVIEASTGITLKVGGNFITIDASGVTVKGLTVLINSGGSALSGSAGSLVPPLSPTDPAEADKAVTGSMSRPGGGGSSSTAPPTLATRPNPSAATDAPTHDPNAEENREKTSWIAIELVGEDGNPIPGEPYRITLADGTTVADGTLDEKGRARVNHIDPGNCKVTFPNRDKTVWRRDGGQKP